jgi:hypothetical protein
MRYVDPSKIIIPQEWLDKAVILQKEIEAIPLLKDKLKHIDKNPIWQDKTLFKALSDVMDGKCWYSEAKDLMSDRDVDHFRPKKKAKNNDNTERDGYWFMAYDWENYRFSSIYSNRLRKDKFTKEDKAFGKGIYFPLQVGSHPAVTKATLVDERAFLIDPTKKVDAALISFNSFGRVTPSVPKTFKWEVERVNASVKFYHLDHSPLKAARRIKWKACQRNIDEIVKLCTLDQRSQRDENMIEFLKNQLVEWSDEKEILSGVAIACLNRNNLSAILTI